MNSKFDKKETQASIPRPREISPLIETQKVIFGTAHEFTSQAGCSRHRTATFAKRVVGGVVCCLLGLSAGLRAAGPQPGPLVEDDHTVFLCHLGPDEDIKVSGQSLEFADGPFKNSKALRLQPTKENHSGAFFTLKRYLTEGTVELWFYAEEESLPSSEPRCIVNLGGAGNTKWRIELRPKGIYGFVTGKDRTAALQGPACDLNKWYHAALTWSAEKGVMLFLNGEKVAEDPRPIEIWGSPNDHLTVGDTPDWTKELGYGWHFNSNNFVGRLAELRVSDIVRETFPTPGK